MTRRRFSKRYERYGMSEAHLALIRQLPSCISGGMPCQAHHLMIASERGVGLRARDMWAVPLTNDEHRQLHNRGSKFHDQWFQERGLSDPRKIASLLWDNTGDLDKMRAVIEVNRP